MAEAKICAVGGCGKTVAKRDYCNAHYKRWKRHGDPLAGAPFRERQNGDCSAPGCAAPARSRGLCGEHYARLRNRGTFERVNGLYPPVGKCRVPGCYYEGALKAGMCVAHHHRVLRYGDASIKLTAANGEPLAWLIEHVGYDGDGCLTWPYARNSYGYGKVSVQGRNVIASRLMCEIVQGAPPSSRHDTAHNCGNGHEGCVHPGHLRWDTRKGNQADRLIHDTHCRGERQWQAKLTESDVKEIRKLCGKESQVCIARRFGVHPTTVSNILTGKRWGWLT